MVRRPAQQAVSNHATDFVASGRELVVIFRFSGIFPDLSPIHPASSGPSLGALPASSPFCGLWKMTVSLS
jgi:hypothetical protein